MEVVYDAARANLRRLLSQYPSWTRQQYAQAVGMSLGWVKQWSKRLREAPPEDEAVLQGQSRARKHPSERISHPKAWGVHRVGGSWGAVATFQPHQLSPLA
jgi:hypothetical protein